MIYNEKKTEWIIQNTAQTKISYRQVFAIKNCDRWHLKGTETVHIERKDITNKDQQQGILTNRPRDLGPACNLVPK